MNLLAYTEQGQGLPVVFLHGFCESKEIWNHYQQEIANNCRFIAIDLPGFGESSNVLDENETIATMAQKVVNTLQELKISHFALVGHSLGGYVSLEIINQFPAHVLGLCMFNSTAFADNDDKKEARNKTIRYVQEHGVEAFIRPFVPGLFYHTNREKCASAIQLLVDIGLKTPKQSIVIITEAMRDRTDFTLLLEDLTFPVLFIVGKQDTAVLLSNSLNQCSLPQHSTSVFYHHTGHMAMFEKEKESLEALKNWINSILRN